MHFQLFVAAVFALTTPIYGRAFSDNTKYHTSDLSQREIWSANVASSDVLPRAVVAAKHAAARARMSLGKSKIGKGKPDPKAPNKWKKSAAWFKKHPGGDNVIIKGTVISKSSKREQGVSSTTAASDVQLGLVSRATVWHPVWVAMYTGGGPFKHWALFVENVSDETKSFIVHVKGSTGNFRFEAKTSNAHASEKLTKIIQVGHVDSKRRRELIESAEGIVIKNSDPTWNCQDFVYKLIIDLADEGILDADDEIYTTGKEQVFAEMEGLA